MSKFAPASISIWTIASSPAAQAYISGVIPFRKRKKTRYLSIPYNGESVVDTEFESHSVYVCAQACVVTAHAHVENILVSV